MQSAGGSCGRSWEREPAKSSFCQRSTGRRLSQVRAVARAGLGWHQGAGPKQEARLCSRPSGNLRAGNTEDLL